MNVEFNDGFVKGWHMAVPEAFKDALKRRRFDEGDVFYDSAKAYELPWAEALRHIGLAVQIRTVIGDEISYVLMRPDSSKKSLQTDGATKASYDEFVGMLQDGFEQHTNP